MYDSIIKVVTIKFYDENLFFFQLLVKLAKKGQNLTQCFRICTKFLLTLISPTIVENIFANPSRH